MRQIRSAFFYNNAAVNLLPALVQRVTGKPLDAYLSERVFGPLGIRDVEWQKDDTFVLPGGSSATCSMNNDYSLPPKPPANPEECFGSKSQQTDSGSSIIAAFHCLDLGMRANTR